MGSSTEFTKGAENSNAVRLEMKLKSMIFLHELIAAPGYERDCEQVTNAPVDHVWQVSINIDLLRRCDKSSVIATVATVELV